MPDKLMDHQSYCPYCDATVPSRDIARHVMSDEHFRSVKRWRRTRPASKRQGELFPDQKTINVRARTPNW
jgi:hypothetical protein